MKLLVRIGDGGDLIGWKSLEGGFNWANGKSGYCRLYLGDMYLNVGMSVIRRWPHSHLGHSTTTQSVLIDDAIAIGLYFHPNLT